MENIEKKISANFHVQISLFLSKLFLLRLKNSHSEKSAKKENRKENYHEIVKTI